MYKKLKLDNSWNKKLKSEFDKDYMQALDRFLNEETLKEKIIFPPSEKIFNAFYLTKFKDVKVIILGQDPYHGIGQANGLSFSVGKEIKIPPSLINIYKELESDLGLSRPNHGDLRKWSSQGVLLLNSVLTVEKGKPSSHADKGWESFTDQILLTLSDLQKNLVFVLWGKKAQEKINFLKPIDNLIIRSAHPSPFSANNGFFGSKPFSRTNEYLQKHKIKLIDWDLNN